jgi:hypothetical protein
VIHSQQMHTKFQSVENELKNILFNILTTSPNAVLPILKLSVKYIQYKLEYAYYIKNKEFCKKKTGLLNFKTLA